MNAENDRSATKKILYYVMWNIFTAIERWKLYGKKIQSWFQISAFLKNFLGVPEP